MKACKIIKTEVEYNEYLKRIEVLMDLESPTEDENNELELRAKLVGDYEEEKFPIDLPSPIDAIKFRMEQEGLAAKDLVQYMEAKAKFPK